MANKAIQVDFLLSGLRESDGTILAGGKVYTYEAGTTTNKAMYTAADKSVEASNPITLNNNGASTAAIYADGTYKVVVKDSDLTTIYTWDNLTFGTPIARFPETTNPTNEANAGYAYTKDDGSGNTEFYYMDDDGNVTKLTNAGSVAGGGVTGPGSSTDNASVRFNGTGGSTIQNSGVIIDDNNNTIHPGSIRLGEVSAPTNVTDKLFIYAKDDSGDTEFFVMDAAGNEIQITKDGGLNQATTLSSFVVVKLSSDQTVTAGAEAVIQFDTEVNDVGSEWDSSVNYNFTAATAGKYLVTLSVTPRKTAGSNAKWRLYKNADVYVEMEQDDFGSGTDVTGGPGFAVLINLAASDTMVFKCQAGTSNEVIESGVQTMGCIVKLGT